MYRSPPARSILTAVLVVLGLASCTDALVTPTTRPSRSIAQVDSVPELPGGGEAPQGCAEDQQESPQEPVDEPTPCPITEIIVVSPPSPPPPPPPPPPSDPPPPPPGGGGTPPPPNGTCDPSVDWDPDCPPPPVCGYLVSADNECISPPGPDEWDVIVSESEAAAPRGCPAINDALVGLAVDVSKEDPLGEMAHFRFEKGTLRKAEDLSVGRVISTAKYHNSRDALSENSARWVARPGYISVACNKRYEIPLFGSKLVFRFFYTPLGGYDGVVERAL